MAIKFKLLSTTPHKGAFVAGDTESGLTSYAYPASEHANIARTMPDRTAAEMLKSATRCGISPTIRMDYDARNWELLNT